MIRQAVGGLNHQHLEHHHRVERLTAALGTIGIGHCIHQIRPEHLEINRTGKGFELITKITEALEAFVNVEKSRLTAHRSPPAPSPKHGDHETGNRSHGTGGSNLIKFCECAAGYWSRALQTALLRHN